MDSLVYESASEDNRSSQPFVQRKVVYVTDTNNGAYGGSQVTFDTMSLSNSGMWTNYNEAYFQIPMVIRMTAEGAGAVNGVRDIRNAFVLGLKNGYHQFVSSMSVDLGNNNVVQLTPNLNYFVSYKLVTTLSDEDVHKHGATINFFRDSAHSHHYNPDNVLDPDGHGSTNNRDYHGLIPTNEYELVASARRNEGFLSRKLNSTAFDREVGTPFRLISNDTLRTTQKNYFSRGHDNGLGNPNSKFWFVTATIRLKDLSDLFEQMPLTKGAFFRFIVNMNTATHSLAYTVATNAITDLSSLNNVVTGSATPILVTSGIADGGAHSLATPLTTVGAGTYPFTVQNSIVRDLTTNTSHPLSACRLYVPLYQMSPTAEMNYISNKIRTITYRDIYNYSFDVPAGGTFSTLLTNGIINPKTLIMIPFIGASVNPTGRTTGGALTAFTSPPFSPFASEPATTSPLLAITDFNVQVSGINLFTSNQIMDFEQYLNELQNKNSINAGLVNGIGSGLIGLQDWQLNYRYMTVDLARRLESEDIVPKSIQVTGRNASLVPITIHAFVEQEKSFQIDITNGQRLS
jgi:hypothetical protein